MQRSGVITQSIITWYCMQHFSDWDKRYITLLIHKRQPLSRLNGRAKGCILWVFWTDLPSMRGLFCVLVLLSSHGLDKLKWTRVLVEIHIHPYVVCTDSVGTVIQHHGCIHVCLGWFCGRTTKDKLNLEIQEEGYQLFCKIAVWVMIWYANVVSLLHPNKWLVYWT